MSEPRRILVTGASGFVGGAIKGYLRSVGHDVHGTVHSRPGDERDTVLDLARQHPEDVLPEGDFDVIVHAAAIVNDARYDRRVRAVNIGGTERMLAFAAARGCRHFIQISSIGAYGFRAAGEDRDEDTPLSRDDKSPPETEYLRSKAAAERCVVASGLPYSTLRMPVVLGRGSSFAAPAMIPYLRRGEAPYFWRRDRRVSLLCESSLGPVVAAFMERGPQNDAFNVCDQHLRWDTLVELYARILGRPVRWKRQGPWAWLRVFRDGHLGFFLSNGCLGAHFPTDKLEGLGIRLEADLERTIREEVEGSSEMVVGVG